MRIGIQTWGSEGDIRPFVALAGGLSAAGHDVTLVVTDVDDRSYDSVAKRLGFRVRHVATPVISSYDAFESIGVSIVQERNPFKQAMAITKHLFDPVIEPMYEAAEVLCSESDMVVGHFIHYPLSIAAERQGVPNVCVTLAPVSIPSRYKGPYGAPSFRGLEQFFLVAAGRESHQLEASAGSERASFTRRPSACFGYDAWRMGFTILEPACRKPGYLSASAGLGKAFPGLWIL